MKIPDSVIHKLQLTITNAGIGESFIYGLDIYKSEHEALKDWRFMECDLSGQPTKYIWAHNGVNKAYVCFFNADYLIDVELDVLLKYMALIKY